jgi:hypothetical protein
LILVFSSLGEYQKLDLIEFFFPRESAKTGPNPLPKIPKYRFPLDRFRDYFGQHPDAIRRYVLNSHEYKTYAKERGRPPPPPEMPRVDKCAEPDRPSQGDEVSAAGAFAAIPTIPAKRAAPEPEPPGTPGAPPGAGARARSCDAAGVAAPTSAPPVSPPQSPGEPLPRVFALTARGN